MTSISLYKVAIKKGTCCGKIEIFLLQTFAKNYSYSLFYRTKQKSHYYNFPSSNDYVCQTAFAKLFVLFCHFLVVMIVVLWYGSKRLLFAFIVHNKAVNGEKYFKGYP